MCSTFCEVGDESSKTFINNRAVVHNMAGVLGLSLKEFLSIVRL